MFMLYMIIVVALFSAMWFTFVFFYDRKRKAQRIEAAMRFFKVERQEAIEIIQEIDRAQKRH